MVKVGENCKRITEAAASKFARRWETEEEVEDVDERSEKDKKCSNVRKLRGPERRKRELGCLERTSAVLKVTRPRSSPGQSCHSLTSSDPTKLRGFGFFFFKKTRTRWFCMPEVKGKCLQGGPGRPARASLVHPVLVCIFVDHIYYPYSTVKCVCVISSCVLAGSSYETLNSYSEINIYSKLYTSTVSSTKGAVSGLFASSQRSRPRPSSSSCTRGRRRRRRRCRHRLLLLLLHRRRQLVRLIDQIRG